jgi:cytochrome c oxidase subunit II
MNLRRRNLSIGAAAAVLGLTSSAAYLWAQTPAPRPKVIKIVAKRFDYTPAHLRLKKGEPVILELTTRDVVMGFNLPDFNLRADIIPDKVTRVSFVPDRTGKFIFLCDIFCGSGHEEMQGSITVIS